MFVAGKKYCQGEMPDRPKGSGQSMGGYVMNKSLLLASTILASLTTMAQAADLKVCVSWSNFR